LFRSESQFTRFFTFFHWVHTIPVIRPRRSRSCPKRRRWAGSTPRGWPNDVCGRRLKANRDSGRSYRSVALEEVQNGLVLWSSLFWGSGNLDENITYVLWRKRSQNWADALQLAKNPHCPV
jgi:hypothetical protein